jgi:iron complex outermembrane receptor protein
VIVLLIFIIPVTSFSQQPKNSIKLIDNESKSAIVGAIYKYGNQSGRSDENGIVILNYEPNKPLYLSHTSYGQWSLSDTQVYKAISIGIVYRENEVFSLLPVTILEVRTKENEKRLIYVEKHDGLVHDAGQFLSQLPEFSGIRKSGNYGYDPVLRGFKYD